MHLHNSRHKRTSDQKQSKHFLDGSTVKVLKTPNASRDGFMSRCVVQRCTNRFVQLNGLVEVIYRVDHKGRLTPVARYMEHKGRGYWSPLKVWDTRERAFFAGFAPPDPAILTRYEHIPLRESVHNPVPKGAWGTRNGRHSGRILRR